MKPYPWKFCHGCGTASHAPHFKWCWRATPGTIDEPWVDDAELFKALAAARGGA